MTNMLHLPSELILQILSLSNDIRPRDIYNVALVSRRLLGVCLPLYLAAEGIPNPEHETSVYVLHWSREDLVSARQPHTLSALNLLPSLTQIKHFSCFFQDPDTKSTRNSFQPAVELPYALDRVSRFVKRLERIESAEIYLVWDQYFVTRTKKIADISLSDLQRWTRAFELLLNLILERGCTSLTVQYDPSIFPAFRFRPPNPMRKAISYLSTRDSEPFQHRWGFGNSQDKSSHSEVDLGAHLSPSAQAIQSITSLSLHSPALLLPPFITWTTSLLRTQNNLTSITFACIAFQAEMWATVLPIIAEATSTRLTELKFFHSCSHLESQDLLNFIYSFPFLTSLSVDRTFRERFQKFKPHSSRGLFSLHGFPQNTSRFSRLKKLRAPVELVSLLLGPSVLPTGNAMPLLPFPSLEALTIYPSSPLIHPPSYIKSVVHVNQLLETIKQRPFSHSLLLALDVQTEFTDFRPVARYIQHFNHGGEFQRTLWETLSDEEIQKLTESGSPPHIAFDHLTHLILHKFDPHDADKTPRSLCIWLKTLFPSVNRLTFTYNLDAHPQKASHMDAGDIQQLVNELQKLCPAVRWLVVRDRNYQL